MQRHILLFQRCLQEAEPLVTQQDDYRQIFCEMKYLATGLSVFNQGREKGSKSCGVIFYMSCNLQSQKLSF